VKYLKLYLVPMFVICNRHSLQMKTCGPLMSFPPNLPKEIENHAILHTFNKNFLKA